MNRPSLTGVRGHLPLLAVLLLGAGLRFYGLDWGIVSLRDFRVDGRELSIQEAGFHPDANFLTMAAQGLRRSIHPHIVVDGQERLFSSYGPVFMYLFWGIGKILSLFGGFDLFNLEGVRDANWTRLAGRSLSALAGTLTVPVAYLIGRRFYGRLAGLAAAFLLAVTPLHIQASHFCTVDTLLALWVTAAFPAFWRVVERGGWRDYLTAGGLIGLACATKLHAVTLFAPLVAAHLIRKANVKRQTSNVKRKGVFSRFTFHVSRFTFALFDRRLFGAVGASVLAFVLLTPASVLRFSDYFLDPTSMLTAISAARVNVGQLVFRGSFHFAGTPPYFYHITDLFPAGLGVPLEVAVFGGIGWAAYRHRREDLLLLSFVALYFLAVGHLQSKPLRYLVPWGPAAAVLAGRFLAEACGAGRKVLRAAGIAFALAVGLYTPAYAAAFTGIYGRPDVRVEAVRWVEEHVQKGSVILLERGHNCLWEMIPQTDYRLKRLDIEDLLSVERIDLLEKANYYPSALYQLYLRHADYLIISDDRLATRGRLPFATTYYDALMDGGFGYTLVREFVATPRFLGIPFDDSGSDVTCRQFDHPRIFVFRRTGEARAFDPAYRSRLPLKSAKQAYETFCFALEFFDILLLHGCLPEDVREAATAEELIDSARRFRARPEVVDLLAEPRFAVREADGLWCVRLYLRTEEGAREQENR